MSTELLNFLTLSYAELEDLNLAAKAQRKARIDPAVIQEERLKYLNDTPGIKAVTLLFSDLEGRLHMLDYDKKFLVKSWDNLTFDGSSIRGRPAPRDCRYRRATRDSAARTGSCGGECRGIRRRARSGARTATARSSCA